MHRLESRTYVGQPNERVTVTTQLHSGGQVDVMVNGQSIGASGQFSLPATAGDRVKMQITLIGPLGASCVVGVATVDGGTDGDFLLCQTHNPAPVNFYTFSVAAAAAVRAIVNTKAAKAKPAKKGGQK